MDFLRQNNFDLCILHICTLHIHLYKRKAILICMKFCFQRKNFTSKNKNAHLVLAHKYSMSQPIIRILFFYCYFCIVCSVHNQTVTDIAMCFVHWISTKLSGYNCMQERERERINEWAGARCTRMHAHTNVTERRIKLKHSHFIDDKRF